MKKLLSFLSLSAVGLVLVLGAAPAPKPGGFVGSSKSNIYHVPSCSSAKRITPTNLVTFATRDDATKKGYRACKVCKP